MKISLHSIVPILISDALRKVRIKRFDLESIRDRAGPIDKFRTLSTVPAFVTGPNVIDEYL